MHRPGINWESFSGQGLVHSLNSCELKYECWVNLPLLPSAMYHCCHQQLQSQVADHLSCFCSWLSCSLKVERSLLDTYFFKPSERDESLKNGEETLSLRQPTMEPSLLLHWCCKGLLAVAIPSPTLSTKEGCDGINFVSCCGSRDILGGRLSIIINFQSKLSNTRDIFIKIPCAPLANSTEVS